MTKYITLGLVLLMAPTVAGQVTPQQAIAQMTLDERRRLSEAILRLAECQECTDGELAEVTASGLAGIPTLGSILRDGPSQTRLQSLDAHLNRLYDRLQAQAARSPAFPMRMTRTEFVDRYTSNLFASYRVRAVQALQAIGGSFALDELLNVDRSTFRADVALAVTDAIDAWR